MRNCRTCGDVFVPDHGNQVYCSEGCGLRRGRVFVPLSTEKECPHCGVLFRRRHPGQVYCSAVCRRRTRRERRARSCRSCGSVFIPRGNQHYCSGCTPRSVRRSQRRYQHLKGDQCERCGFLPEHPCQLDVHHRDGDHENNAPANLETLCANCHRLENLGRRKPTPREAQAMERIRQMVDAP